MGHAFHIPGGWDDPTTWVLIALAAFLAFVVYLKVPGLIASKLDERAKGISDELDEARRLREEAQELLSGYQRRQREAEREADAIIEQAKRDAERMAEDMRANLAEQLERRAAMAERKIAQAEADASAAVQRQAAELAAQAAERIIREQLDTAGQNRLIEESVEELARRLS